MTDRDCEVMKLRMLYWYAAAKIAEISDEIKGRIVSKIAVRALAPVHPTLDELFAKHTVYVTQMNVAEKRLHLLGESPEPEV